MVCHCVGCVGLLWVVVAMAIDALSQRIAELWTLQKGRKLTDPETTEFAHCMNAFTKHWWELAYLKNLSLMASMTNDVPWQHEVCLEMDDLQQGIKRKKPGPKATD